MALGVTTDCEYADRIYSDDGVLIRTTITILDIIHRPVFYLKHNVSETGFCLRLHVETTQIGAVGRANLSRRTAVGST
jgi:hypothetical protein